MPQSDRNVGELIELARNPSRDSRSLLFRHILTLLTREPGLSDGERANLNAIILQLLPHIDPVLRNDYFRHFGQQKAETPPPAETDASAGLLERAALQLARARRQSEARTASDSRTAETIAAGPAMPEPAAAEDNTQGPRLRALLDEDGHVLPPRGGADELIDWARDLLIRDFDYTRAAADWTWETDPHGLLTHLSDGATAALCRPHVLLLGNSFEEIGRFAEASHLQAWSRCLARQRPFDDLLLHTGVGQNAQTWVLRGVPAFDFDSGRFLGFRGSARLRSELTPPALAENPAECAVELDESLVNAGVAAARPLAGLAREPATTERLYTLSHEFRTPLNAIMGFSELMAGAAMGPLEARYQNYAAGIGAAARRLLAIINDVLEKAQIEAGTIQLEPTLIRLDHLVEATVTEFLHSAPLHGCTLALDFQGPTAVVFADGEFLRAMLAKILAEAVHLTEDHCHITVHTRMHDARTVEIGIDGLRLPSDITIAFWLMTNRLRDEELSPETMTGAFRLVLLRQTVRLVNGDILLQGDAADAGRPQQLLLRVPTFQGNSPHANAPGQTAETPAPAPPS